MCTANHSCRLAISGEDAITQSCIKASFTRADDFYVMRLSPSYIYSVEYSDKIMCRIEYEAVRPRSCTLSKIYHRNHTHTWAIYSDWARNWDEDVFSHCALSQSNERLIEVLNAFFFFLWRKGYTHRHFSYIFMLHGPWSRHYLLQSRILRPSLPTESPVSSQQPTLSFQIIHLFKNQINLLLYSSHKTDKNITVNASMADVVYSDSTVKL